MSHRNQKIQKIRENKEVQSQIAKENKKNFQVDKRKSDVDKRKSDADKQDKQPTKKEQPKSKLAQKYDNKNMVDDSDCLSAFIITPIKND